MTIVKFCGMRRRHDIEHAKRLGCDLIGLNFVQASPRYIEPSEAREIVDVLQDQVLFVGVFKDANEEVVNQVLERVELNFLQFHAAESAAFCESFKLPYIKSIAVARDFDFAALSEQHPNAYAFLLDSPSATGGGSGETFSWDQFPQDSKRRVILAGGLNPENVASAIKQTQPWGVDVASGIEGEEHQKDTDLMTRFIHEVRNVPA